MKATIRHRIALLAFLMNTLFLVFGALTSHPAIAAPAAIGMVAGALYLNRTAR